jgi:hypothetical protein
MDRGQWCRSRLHQCFGQHSGIASDIDHAPNGNRGFPQQPDDMRRRIARKPAKTASPNKGPR